MENKWWEYYAVRYFVGTVVGALVVAFLNLEPGSPFKDRLAILGASKEATFLGVGLVAALGFAFCYIASAPVLTLHATRAHLRFSVIRASPCTFACTLILPTLLTICLFWQFLSPIAAASSGFVIGVESGLVLLTVFTKFNVVENFYRDLATARSNGMPKKDNPPTPGIEYITSYRHLREHGNAFLIVLLEGLLAYTLFHSPSRCYAMTILALWLFPAATVWLVGTVLESRLVSKTLL
jgi:hypothetical protein